MLTYLLENKKLLGVLAWVGIFASVYGYLYNKTTELTYEVLSNTDVVEVKEHVSKLAILYDGRSLQENHQTLRAITVRIRNSGENTIKIGDYDEKLPLGFSIDHGEILETPQVSGSKNYLTQIIRPKLVSKSSLSFSAAILEPNDYFQVNILVLAPDTVAPKIIPEGVVAGLSRNSPELVDAASISKSEAFYEKVFGGDWKIQAARAPSYCLFLFFVMLAISAITNLPRDILFYREDVRIRAQRVVIAQAYISDLKVPFNPIIEYIIKEYTDRVLFKGQETLSKFEDLYSLQKELRKRIKLNDLRRLIPEGQTDLVPGLSQQNRRLEMVMKFCGFVEGYDMNMALAEIDKQLSVFLEYLSKHNHPIGYVMRKEDGVHLLFLDAYKRPHQFEWFTAGN